MSEESWDIEAFWQLLDPRALVYLLVVMAVLWIARKIFDWATPYNLAEQLTDKDNKAIAVSFGGYLLAVGAVLLAVLGADGVDNAFNPDDGLAIYEGETPGEFFRGLGLAVAWSLGGIVLLQLARWTNDRVILHRFSNVKELVDDQNVGTGAVECGSYLGSGILLHAALAGEASGWLHAVTSTLIYFVVGQLLFICFVAAFSGLVRFDLHEQLEADNAAAGVSLGMSMVAMALLLAGFIRHTSSLPGLALWFLLCLVILLVTRYLVDKLILPGDLLDEEVARDRNWGAALVEGASALVVAVVVNACFLV